MEKPDVELEIQRDEGGRVTKLSYKVHNAGEEGKRALEGLELMRSAVESVFASEGPEDRSVYVPVDFHIG